MDFEKDHRTYQEIKNRFNPKKGEGFILVMDNENLDKCTLHKIHNLDQCAEIVSFLASEGKHWAVIHHLRKHPELHTIFESFRKSENLKTGKVTYFRRRMKIDPVEVAREFRKLEALLKGSDPKAS